MKPPRRPSRPRRALVRLPEMPLLGDLFDLSRTSQLAIVFAYWLYMAAAGLFAGMPVSASLLLSFVFLAIAIGFAALYVGARDRLEDDLAGRVLIALSGSLAALFGVLIVLMPLIVFLLLGLQLLFSIPVWLVRR
jgi:uncharacterized membrane protein HdeD (DUF308 family)